MTVQYQNCFTGDCVKIRFDTAGVAVAADSTYFSEKPEISDGYCCLHFSFYAVLCKLPPVLSFI